MLKSVVYSSPMGPFQGMSDRARAADALMKENIVLAKDLKSNALWKTWMAEI